MSDEEMDQLLTQVERELGAAWVEAVEWLREENQLEDVEARVKANDFKGAIAGLEDAAQRYAAAVHAGYITAGEAAAAWLDAQLPRELVTFDAMNWRAVQWAQANKLELVREITEEQRAILWQVHVRGTEAATNPIVVARDLRQAIGLTAKQEGIVARYRVDLETGKLRRALGRELADGRWDASLRAAIRDGRTIQPEQIDRMVEAYRRNWVGYRGKMIARTEGLRVIHEGTEELFDQAVESGTIDAERLLQQWNSHHDGRERWSHGVIDKQKRAIGQPFRTGAGYLLRYPGDRAAPASETIHCRCNRSMRLLSADKVRELLAAQEAAQAA